MRENTLGKAYIASVGISLCIINGYYSSFSKDTYCKLCTGKHYFNACPVPKSVQQWDALPPLVFSLALEFNIRNVRQNRRALELSSKLYHSVYGADNNGRRAEFL
jgi:hypothetical protein